MFTARCACFGSSVCVGMHCFHCMGFPTLVPPNSDSSRELPYQFRHRGFPINSVPEVFLVSLSDGYFLVGVSSVRRTAVDPKSFALSLFSCWVLLVQGICPFVCVLVSLTLEHEHTSCDMRLHDVIRLYLRVYRTLCIAKHRVSHLQLHRNLCDNDAECCVCCT